MTFTSVLLTILWLMLIPTVVGSAFTLSRKGFIAEGMRSYKTGMRLMGIFMWSWLFGQLLLWCLFQILAVYEIIQKNRFSKIVREYTIVVIALCVIAVATNVIREIKGRTVTGLISGRLTEFGVVREEKGTKRDDSPDKSSDDNTKLLVWAWIIFAVLLVVQVVLQAVLAYMDADDSYYVSEAVAINSSDNMYTLIPYTGQTTEMDFRHSLEPFPAWLAFISRISGTNVTSMAHVLLPVLLLPLTYGIYAIIGSRMLGMKKSYLPLFLVAVELLTMFGLYSTRNPEKFFVTRIRQGKSALASLIIPAIILCLFLILDYAKKKKRTDIRLWIMLFMLNTAGCLCSTLGALLCAIPVAVVAIIMVFAYRKGWHLIPMMIGCTPCLVYALLYLIRG